MAKPSAKWSESYFRKTDQSKLSLRKNLIKDQIDNDSGHGNIHPYGPSPAGNSGMFLKISLCRSKNGHKNHRNDCNGQYEMGQQDTEIDRPKPSGILKCRVSDSVKPLHPYMIGDVADQKER